MSTSIGAEPRAQQLLGGDGLRGLGCLMVFAIHAATGAAQAADRPGLVAAYGPLGAVLIHMDFALFIFFALSGYLIGRPFVRALLDGRPLPSMRRYARNRLLRVVPVLWALTTIILLRHLLLPDAFPRGTFLVHARRIPAIYLFLQTYLRSPAATLVGPAWSLHPEMGFYLLLPFAAIGLALLKASRRTRLTGILVLLAAVFVLSIGLHVVTPDTLEWRRSIPENLFAFVPGLLLAVLEPFVAPRLQGRRWGRGLALGLMAVGLGLLLLNAAVPNRDLVLADTDWWRAATRAMGAGSVLAGTLTVQWATGSCWWILAAGPLRWLGVRSYSFYLLHQAVGLELTGVIRGRNQWLAFGIGVAFALPVSLLLCHLSFFCFERPFMRRKQRLRAGLSPA